MKRKKLNLGFHNLMLLAWFCYTILTVAAVIYMAKRSKEIKMWLMAYTMTNVVLFFEKIAVNLIGLVVFLISLPMIVLGFLFCCKPKQRAVQVSTIPEIENIVQGTVSGGLESKREECDATYKCFDPEEQP